MTVRVFYINNDLIFYKGVNIAKHVYIPKRKRNSGEIVEITISDYYYKRVLEHVSDTLFEMIKLKEVEEWITT